MRCLMIELRETEIDALIRRGLLKNETRNDPSAIINALYAFLDSTLGDRHDAQPGEAAFFIIKPDVSVAREHFRAAMAALSADSAAASAPSHNT
jgi:hypothetical protein